MVLALAKPRQLLSEQALGQPRDVLQRNHRDVPKVCRLHTLAPGIIFLQKSQGIHVAQTPRV